MSQKAFHRLARERTFYARSEPVSDSSGRRRQRRTVVFETNVFALDLLSDESKFVWPGPNDELVDYREFDVFRVHRLIVRNEQVTGNSIVSTRNFDKKNLC